MVNLKEDMPVNRSLSRMSVTPGQIMIVSWGHSQVNIWYNLKQIATEIFSVGMHSGEVSLEHTKNPLPHPHTSFSL